MTFLGLVARILATSTFLASLGAAENNPPSAADLATAIRRISLDSTQTYHVRDLQLARGGIKIYLNEGILSFFTPIAGHRIGAVFATEGVEAGDAEIILMPPLRSERASLAFFSKTPNLDEHLHTAVFFFTDNTEREILDQITRGEVRTAPDMAGVLAERLNPVGRSIAAQIDVLLIEGLLDRHRLADGMFYSVIAGRTLGAFDVTYDPTQSEPVFVGRVSDALDKKFQLWTNFRSPRAPRFVPPEPSIRDYRIEASISRDLGLDVTAAFKIKTSDEDGRVLPLSLSPRLDVSSATIGGLPAEVFQHASKRLTDFGSTETFLLVSTTPFAPGAEYRVELRYSGSIIRQTATGEYFVDERSSWYPINGPVPANFDLTFHCPDRLHLVSTGELVGESTKDGVLTVQRRTIAPAALAGFNLGVYETVRKEAGPYSIEIDSPDTRAAELTADPTLPGQTANILAYYTKRWIPLRIHSVAVTPIDGYFGQGFPGLIYLSSVSYTKEENRLAVLRNPRFDAFFSELLLPHEIAHQWWGNIVHQDDYRSAWITEAMANQSALNYIEATKGALARDEILDSYREDLTKEKDDKTIESSGPVNFGQRLIDNFGMSTWQIILYEKGSWILRMLSQRLGEENFRNMQLRLLQQYSARPLNNEEFRQVASSFVPPGQPDPSLNSFFDTWVYGTGIPAISMHAPGRMVDVTLSGVDDDFMVEIPLRCRGGAVYWVRAGAGTNTFELPTGKSACELPSPRDFLYIPVKKR